MPSTQRTRTKPPSKTTRTTIWRQASCNSGEEQQIYLPFRTLSPLTVSIVQCARSKSWCPTPPFSTVQRGTPFRFHPILHLIDRDPSCRRRDSVVPTTNPYFSLANPTKMVPSTYSDDMDGSFGSKTPTYVAAMRPTPRPTSDARIPPKAQ